MMSQISQPTSAHPSLAVAQAIANICPDALFCGFKVKQNANGTSAKIPFNKQSQGVAASTPKSDLIQGGELSGQPPGGDYWGVVMQNPTFDPFGELVLTVLDLDTKRSTAPTHIRMAALMSQAKAMGLMTERSYSKKGGHIIFLAKPDPDMPPKISLGNHQEIEIFGHPKSAGKSVMLTGDALKGDVNEINCTLQEFLAQAGITIEKAPEPKTAPAQLAAPLFQRASPPDEMYRVADALQFISPDIEYNEWIKIGQALHTAFGPQGFDLWYQWSSMGSKFQGPEDMNTHWKSFNEQGGITLGSLFHQAKQLGYEPPTKKDERRTAVEDFGRFLKAQEAGPTVDQDTGEITQPQALHWPEIDYSLTRLEPIQYLVDGFLAHSLFVMAGQPGVGKTSALIALAMVQAGFHIEDCELKTRKKRKTIFVTEDSDQIVRSLFAYGKHFGIDPTLIAQTIVIIDARRSDVKDILKLAQNCEKHTLDGQRPWLVLDTANATLDLDDENDNAKVGQYLSSIKATLFVQMGVPVCITAHTNKTISRKDSDAQARGASAFTGDATLTGILFLDDDQQRYMKLTKTRYEPTFREIRFDSQTFTEAVTDTDGELQEIVCRVSVPHISSEELRVKAAAEKADEKRQDAIMDKCDQACAYIQSMMNQNNNGVIIQRGAGRISIPDTMVDMTPLRWADILDQVPGANNDPDMKKAIKQAVCNRYGVDHLGLPGWVQLHG
jgi:hypothetical protein